MIVHDFFDLSEPFQKLYLENKELWSPLAKLKELFTKEKLGNIEIPIPETVFLENKELISIGKGTAIEPGAFIRGPCIIGENCLIRHGAYIRGFVWTGKNCLIGHATEVKNSILFDHVSSAHFAYVGDSILGNGVNLGAGVKCANYRLDSQVISITIDGQKISTGLKKMGCIIGDGGQVGCNAVLSPGTLLAKGCKCYPCLHVNGYHSKNSYIVS